MDRTACTEPQCLYKGALYIFLPHTKYAQLLYNAVVEDNLKDFSDHLHHGTCN